jgi:hypothetical protein
VRTAVPVEGNEAVTAPADATPTDESGPMAIAEPGVVSTDAPFAQVYTPVPVAAVAPSSPPPLPGNSPTTFGQPSSITGTPPPAVGGYYPPAYPPPAWPAAPPQSAVEYRSSYVGARYARPGVVTAIGVSGIVFAALSFIASAFSGCTGVMVMGFSATSKFMARAGTVTYSAATTMPTNASAAGGGGGSTAAAANPNGLSPSERRAVAQALEAKSTRALSAERRNQLDQFLLEHGRLLFGGGGGSGQVLSRDVADAVENSGQIAGGANFFILKKAPGCAIAGQLTLRDGGAVFESADMATELRSMRKAKPAGDAGAAADPAVATPALPGGLPVPGPSIVGETLAPLDAQQAAAVVAQIRQRSNGRLSPAQASTVARLLTGTSSAYWVANVSTLPGLTVQVTAAVAQSDGSITVDFVNGTSMPLDAAGNLTGPMPPAVSASPGASGASAPFAVPSYLGAINVTNGAITLAITAAALSGLVAIYLLVLSILILRQSAGGRRMLLIFALVKIVVAVMAITAFTQIYAGVSGHQLHFPVGASLTFAWLGLAFPLGVLAAIYLNKGVREYFGTAGR